jgi:hypothetical protein
VHFYACSGVYKLNSKRDVIKTESFDLFGRLCASFNEIELKSFFRLFSSLECSDLKDNWKQIDFDEKNY